MKPARALTTFDLFCIGVNGIVGAGIYTFPGLLARDLGPLSIFTFAACGLALASVALCFAECASMFEQSGGPYVYAEAAFGSHLGFGVGWVCWACAVFSWATVAAGVGGYLATLIPSMDFSWGRRLGGALALSLFALVNYVGLKPGAWTTNFFTVTKLLPLFALVAVGLFKIDVHRLVPLAPHGWAAFGGATFMTLFAVQGFEAVPVPAGETQRARYAVPLAVVGSLLFASLLYILIQLVSVGTTVGLEQAVDRPLVAVGQAVFGNAGITLFAVGGTLSMLGYLAGSALVSPRYLYALGENRRLWNAFSAVHPKFGTPHVAIVTTWLLTLVLTLSLNFERLVDLAALAVLTQYLSTALAFLRLRRKQPGAPRRYRVPAGSLVGWAAVLLTLALATQAKPGELAAFGGVVILGYLVYALRLRGCAQSITSQSGFDTQKCSPPAAESRASSVDVDHAEVCVGR